MSENAIENEEIEITSENLTKSELAEKYPNMALYTRPLKKAERDIIGRDDEIESLLAAFARPELCNVILIAEAGSGKTALVQATMVKDETRTYLEVDLSKMIANLNDPNEMAVRLKGLFGEVEQYNKSENKECVLFIDEFHQIVQMSDAAVEALKPMLADSGTRGIRVVAATTFDEFREYVQPNQALMERLMRLNLAQPGRDVVVQILRGMAKTYGVSAHFYDDSLFELIYEYTNRYVPASNQPRKSILVLDAMIGWNRSVGEPFSKDLIAKVINESQNVDVAFKIDATSIKDTLDKHVLAQQFASAVIENRLQICVADLQNKSKPQSSFLFCGSTGVGKLVTNDTLVPIYPDTINKDMFWKRHGDLCVGDKVISRTGQPINVTGVYPHKNVDIYKVHFSDGRTLDVGDEHLWTVYSEKQRDNYYKGKNVTPYVMSTKQILKKGVVRQYEGSTRHYNKWFIPMNGAVNWPNKLYDVAPYVVGAFIGNGCLTDKVLTLSSLDSIVVDKICGLIGAKSYYKNPATFSYNFELNDDDERKCGKRKYFFTKDLFGNMPELLGVYSKDRRIPEKYMCGSIRQRWDLVQGLFDTDGTVSDDSRLRVTYSTFSKGLADDVHKLLLSLGVSSTITKSVRKRETNEGFRELIEYRVHVKIADDNKEDMFWLFRKRIIVKNNLDNINKTRVKKYDFVGITDIEYIGKQDAQCIMVDDPEHLYQAGDFVVTHNTEMTKQLAKLLFNDERQLIRFDMTEYAMENSLERFREELTARVWERPNSIILLDEVEKANASVTRVLLQVLDDGRLIDRYGKEVSFINSYIIMTTNAGTEIYKTIAQYRADDEGSGRQLAKYMKLIRRSLTVTTGNNKFPPELLGRIDTIVPFQPLSEATMGKIAIMKLKNLQKEIMQKYHIKMEIEKKVINYLLYDKLDTDSDAGGARVVVSKIEEEVVTNVARFINHYPDVRKIGVRVEGEMATENKNKLQSEAYIDIISI